MSEVTRREAMKRAAAAGVVALAGAAPAEDNSAAPAPAPAGDVKVELLVKHKKAKLRAKKGGMDTDFYQRDTPYAGTDLPDAMTPSMMMVGGKMKVVVAEPFCMSQVICEPGVNRVRFTADVKGDGSELKPYQGVMRAEASYSTKAESLCCVTCPDGSVTLCADGAVCLQCGHWAICCADFKVPEPNEPK